MGKPYYESSYKFKLIKSSWGIYAQICAKVQPKKNSTYNAEYRISDLIWFTFNGKITAPQTDLELMIKGLKTVSDDIEKHIDEEILIVIIDFQIAHSDYQKDGMYYAFIEWANHHFGFIQKEINCYFDIEKNKYVFPELD
jgi:hypothetical protein